jgi:8-oxo-dGTP diphosphatase
MALETPQSSRRVYVRGLHCGSGAIESGTCPSLHRLCVAKMQATAIARVPLTRVLAAVIERDGYYLVCQRPAHKRHGNLWEFPGGKVEAGETQFEATHRELAEELDVRVLSVRSAIFAVADPGSDFLIEFVPTTIEGSPRCLEHLDLQWLSPADLQSLKLAPSDRRFVDFLLSSQ